MAPIEGHFFSPTLKKSILAKNGRQEHFHIYDLSVDLEGNEAGGYAFYKHDSQTKPKKIHVESGETIEKQVKVVAKGGVLEEIKMRFTGK